MEEPVTIYNIGKGVLGELFDRELEKVVADILDLNTKAEVVRVIDIKIAIKPDENRNFGIVGIFVSSSLGKPKPVGGTMFFGRKNGKVVAVQNEAQEEMFDKAGPRPVVSINKGTGEVTAHE
jgi:hypothetical protein